MNAFWPAELTDLDFELPDELIATEPASPADHARLMVIDRAKQTVVHDRFFNLPKYLSAGDAVFYNATQVEARRTFLKRENSDKLFECVFLKKQAGISPGETWQVLMRNIRRLKDGAALVAAKDAGFSFTLQRHGDQVLLTSARPLTVRDFLRIGEMPIPPYMKRAADAKDETAYQNFFQNRIEDKNKVQGSAASPTAALHFTPELFSTLQTHGVEFHPVCLDIGYGTFAPLTEENFTTGKLHAEHYYIPPASLQVFTAAAAARKIALGTTSLRALLSCQKYGAAEGETELFVGAGDTIAGVDGLITNFHLPRSSLLLLTAAFCGRSLLGRAYQEAIALRYRFYSYGDAMLIV